MSDDKAPRKDSEEVQDEASKQLSDSEKLAAIMQLTGVRAAQNIGPIIYNAAVDLAAASAPIVLQFASEENPFEVVTRVRNAILMALGEGLLYARLAHIYETTGIDGMSEMLNKSLQSIVTTLNEHFGLPFKITVKLEEEKKPNESPVHPKTMGKKEKRVP